MPTASCSKLVSDGAIRAALYQTTFAPCQYMAAHELAGSTTPATIKALIVRPRELHDNAVSSGNAMTALVGMPRHSWTMRRS
jgi:hypothetical protein